MKNRLFIIFVLAMLVLFGHIIFQLVDIAYNMQLEIGTQTEIIKLQQAQIDELARFQARMRDFMDRLQIEEFDTSAYSPHDDRNGLNSWRPKLASRDYTVRTRTGTLPRPGTVAVDPAVIPLGTSLWVQGYGFCRAEDTGGAVRGQQVDLYKETFDEAMVYGRQKKTVMWVR